MYTSLFPLPERIDLDNVDFLTFLPQNAAATTLLHIVNKIHGMSKNPVCVAIRRAVTLAAKNEYNIITIHGVIALRTC